MKTEIAAPFILYSEGLLCTRVALALLTCTTRKKDQKAKAASGQNTDSMQARHTDTERMVREQSRAYGS